MRKPLIAGNWKMNLTTREARNLVSQMTRELKSLKGCEVVLIPPFTSIPAVLSALEGQSIEVGAQNLHWELAGAFTGEISAEMIKEVGCTFVLVGHSERRQYFFETNETANKRMHAALRAGLQPILCVGETLAEREANKTKDVVFTQLEKALIGIGPLQMKSVVVAYEPVWAIGTGKTASSAQAQEVHQALREKLKALHGQKVADETRFLYGGSVKAQNAKELLTQPDVDGALVGGASLQADSFLGIVRAQVDSITK